MLNLKQERLQPKLLLILCFDLHWKTLFKPSLFKIRLHVTIVTPYLIITPKITFMQKLLIARALSYIINRLRLKESQSSWLIFSRLAKQRYGNAQHSFVSNLL